MTQDIAEELAKKQRAVSVAEFFERNRHLLGFDNKRKALLTVVKEAVDNSLDACEEAKILPEINVELIDMGNDRFRIIIEDNGPGIIKKQIPSIFARLLYGSKFHTLKQARGQQGIGISAAVLYSQLSTGRPAKITSRTSEKQPAHYYELHINTQTNSPEIVKEEIAEWKKDHGTRIEMDIEATYQKGIQSVDEYLKETAIVNPHATIVYVNPKAEQFIFARTTDNLPKEPKEIKPHPYGVELGILMKMIKLTDARTLQSFFSNEFSRMGPTTIKEICEKAAVPPNTKPSDVNTQMGERLIKAIRETKIIAPPTDCISPIGSELLEQGLKKEIPAEFYTSVTRPPSVYRGMPFIIECAIAYGGTLEKDKQVNVLRFANRVPLLYQAGACAITKSIIATAWKSYGLSQSQGALPVGPAVIVVHLASVWPPFTSEAKEAIAHYPEIIKEIKLALQECGRNLARYVGKKKRVHDALKKKGYIEKYLPHVGQALKELLQLSEKEESRINDSLKEILEKTRSIEELEKVEHDESEERLGILQEEEVEDEG
ncbi:DNA topoisomerase VI subunit B [Candidatus Woesearchaeota archaeon]|nr:DNA topoisomerase VI subunit B [Candidatus Woesearchaeota archaeon]